MQEERAPLYGRFDLSLLLHPFRPHEAAQLLPRLKRSGQALVWGIVGGIPLCSWSESSTVIRVATRTMVRHTISLARNAVASWFPRPTGLGSVEASWAPAG